jgi:ubiquinol-cytochrome c reductase cytochrome b subunit
MLTEIRSRLQTLTWKDVRAKAREAADQRTRAILAGVGIEELQAILRGDPPTEKPNPRYKVHTSSFLFHIRPRYYQAASTWFSHTFRLGWFTAFLFLVEILTGLILMIYYVPSPEQAYDSIYLLLSNVPFGQMLRDIHRLGAELMVIFTALHMFRTFMTGSYKKERSFTWLTGVVLLGITLLLSFSGYLLPWDQLAYWAVTIGTSMAEAAPLFGNQVNLLLRGAPDIGAGGLLRFYLLHVVLMPLLGIWFFSIHYYKVSREHGISLPARVEEGNVSPEEKKRAMQRIDWLPDLMSHEVFLTCLGIFVIIIATAFFFHAPLEHIANPQKTPLDTEAPWYFLWLQGMLKLGDKTLMGIILPTILVMLLVAVPYIDRNPYRSLYRRPLAVGVGLMAAMTLIALSYMGTPSFGIRTPPATRIVQDLAPEEGAGPLRVVPFDQLQAGVYEVGKTPTTKLCPNMDFGCPSLEKVFAQYTQAVDEYKNGGELPNAQAVMVIEDWQKDLKKVTTRILWDDPTSGSQKTYEHSIYIHRNRHNG